MVTPRSALCSRRDSRQWCLLFDRGVLAHHCAALGPFELHTRSTLRSSGPARMRIIMRIIIMRMRMRISILQWRSTNERMPSVAEDVI